MLKIVKIILIFFIYIENINFLFYKINYFIFNKYFKIIKIKIMIVTLLIFLINYYNLYLKYIYIRNNFKFYSF